MATHCGECGAPIQTVEEGREHKRKEHPVIIFVSVPEGVKYRLHTSPVKEVVVDIQDDDIPVRILRPTDNGRRAQA